MGHTSANVKRIFQQARANAPTILFIDEADTVFQTRDAFAGESDSFAKDMVNQFLVEMDGLGTGKSKVFVIAATNRIGTLDSAIKSRLGTPIAITLPDKDQRKQLFANHLKDKEAEQFKKCFFFDEFIDKTNRMSGRDIKNFVNSLHTEAKKKTNALNEYTEEAEIRELFYTTLKKYEEDLIAKLESELHLEIKRPSEKLNYKSIIGCDAVKVAIDKQMRMFSPAERKRAKTYNIEPRRGILLYGPPRNGKSRLAEAAASEKHLLFMKVTSDTFTKNTVSDTSQALIRIFNSAVQLSEMCSEQKGVLLFFDEFDALASTQILDGRIRGTLLTQLDDRETMRNPITKVLFVAATNNIELLDEASIRPGRIDEKIKMDNPSPEEGVQMIRQFFEKNDHVEVPGDDISEMAYKTYVTLAKKKRLRNLSSRIVIYGWRKVMI